MTRRLLYLIGEPGAGKSTLVAQALPEWRANYTAHTQPVKHLVYLPSAIVLGEVRARFSGTDALHMAVQPAVERFLAERVDLVAVFGEGDRLGNGRFFDWAFRAGFDLTVAWLDVPPEIAAARRRARGSEQAPSWVKGRATKVARLVETYRERVWRLDGTLELETLATVFSTHPVIRAILSGVDSTDLWHPQPASPPTTPPPPPSASFELELVDELAAPGPTSPPAGPSDFDSRLVTCPLCGGAAEVNGVPCPECDGEGWKPRDSADEAQESLFDLGPLTAADPLAAVRRHINAEEPVTPAARMEVFRNAVVKGLKFAYPLAEYEAVIARLDRLVKETGCGNNSRALVQLLDHWERKGAT